MLSPNLLSTKPYATSSKAQPEHGPSQKSRVDHGAKDWNWSSDLKGLRNPVPVLKFWMGPSITTVIGPSSRTEPQSLRTDNPQSLWNHVTLSFPKSFWLKLRRTFLPRLTLWTFWPSGSRFLKIFLKTRQGQPKVWIPEGQTLEIFQTTELTLFYFNLLNHFWSNWKTTVWINHNDQASTDKDGRLRTVHPSIRPCGQRTKIKLRPSIPWTKSDAGPRLSF